MIRNRQNQLKYVICCLLFLMMAPYLNAQSHKDYKLHQPWSIYLNTGLSNYFKAINSDLDPYYNSYFNKINPMFGVGIRRDLNNVFSVEFEYLYGYAKAIGDDYSHYQDFNLNGLINITNLNLADVSSRRLALYGKVGIGLNQFDASANILQPEKDSKFAFQAGMMLKYDFTKNLGLRLGTYVRGLSEQYYEGGMDKDYNFLRNPYYFVGEFGVNYKFSITKDSEKSSTELLSALDLDKTYGMREIPLAVDYEDPLQKGHVYNLEIKIRKGDLATTGKIELPLPEGVHAWNDSTKSFTDREVVVNYPMLPSENKIELSVRLLPGKMYDDEQNVKGVFQYYIAGDQKVSSEVSLTKEAAYKFSVQVGAFAQYQHTKEELAMLLGLTEPISKERHKGMVKYILGTFNSYPEAIEFRNSIREKANIKDAFVVGYKNGKRLSTLKGEFYGVYQ